MKVPTNDNLPAFYLTKYDDTQKKNVLSYISIFQVLTVSVVW
jgi:hypothetical protein